MTRTDRPQLLFRADARADLGGGHVMRCLSLADALSRHEVDIAFCTNADALLHAPALARHPYPVCVTESLSDITVPPGWHPRPHVVIADLYDQTAAHERVWREQARRLVVIEDLPGRRHDCDLIIDPQDRASAQDYAERAPGSRVCLGPDYALLRPGFAAARHDSLMRDRSRVRRVVISMGLTDVGASSARLARSLLDLAEDIEISVILGPLAPSRAILEPIATTEPRLELAIDVDDMEQRLAGCDLVIGAGGGSALERCVLGVPSLICPVAENQWPLTRALAARNAVRIIDPFEPERALAEIFRTLDEAALAEMSQASAAYCDGLGAERCAEAIIALARRSA